MESAYHWANRLVKIAHYLTLFIIVLVTGYIELPASNVQVYLLAICLYALLITSPCDLSMISGSMRLLLSMILLAYIYYWTPAQLALPLFYLYILRAVILLTQRQAALISAIVIAVFTASTFYKGLLANGVDHVILAQTGLQALSMLFCGVITQKLAHRERYERQQNQKIEDLLQQMEQSYKQIAALAERDGLTGLYNYRAFRQKVDELDINRAAIILIDIDFFKDFNDQYGHLCGDAVLQQMAAVIKNNVRGHDMLFRYGGEEFAIIFQDITDDELEAVSLRIRRSVAAHQFYYDEQKLERVTVSIGYAAAGPNIKTAKELFQAADTALYAAKNHGRNSVCRSNGQILADVF